MGWRDVCDTRGKDQPKENAERERSGWYIHIYAYISRKSFGTFHEHRLAHAQSLHLTSSKLISVQTSVCWVSRPVSVHLFEMMEAKQFHVVVFGMLLFVSRQGMSKLRLTVTYRWSAGTLHQCRGYLRWLPQHIFQIVYEVLCLASAFKTNNGLNVISG